MKYETNLKERIRAGEIIYFSINDIDNMNLIIENLSIDLSDEPLFPLIKTAIIEFLLNAFKASHKRYFFKEFGYNIVSDYKIGMQSFRRAISDGRIEEISLNKNISPIQLILKMEMDFFKLTVKNEIAMTDEECANVKKVFLQGKEILGIEEHLNGGDNAEGAGLGLLLIFSMLKNASLPSSSILFERGKNETKFELKIPMNCFTS